MWTEFNVLCLDYVFLNAQKHVQWIKVPRFISTDKHNEQGLAHQRYAGPQNISAVGFLPVLSQLHADVSLCGEDDEGDPQHGAATHTTVIKHREGQRKYLNSQMIHPSFTWWTSPPAASQRSKSVSSGSSRFQI